MSDIYLMSGDVVCMDKQWLILDIKDDFCLLVLLESTKTRFQIFSYHDMKLLIDQGEIKLAQARKKNDTIVAFSDYGASATIHERMRRMADDIQHKETSLFWLVERDKRAAFINELAEKYEVSTSTVRRFLREYLQNNCSLRGLGCMYFKCGGKGKRKNYKNGLRAGRRGISQISRTDEVVSQFETMKKRYLAKKARISFTNLYEDLIKTYYSVRKISGGEYIYEPYAMCERPTQKQLYYFIKSGLTDEDIYITRHGKRNAWNNIRALHSDTIADLELKSIGTRYEIDETETDFYLVSRYDRNQVIGRAILYMAVDVYSKMITGVSVGIDNNSWAGAEMLLLNMAEDKVTLCERAGIAISEDDWPVCRVLPSEIEVDNGSEYLSKACETYAREQGIHLMFTPSRMGSFKGNIEQKFRQFHACTKGIVPGEIRKDAYGTPHIREACLTIEEMYQIVLEFVLSYNRTPMTDYLGDAAFTKTGIVPSPLNIWNWKLEQENGLRRIMDMGEYKFSLLKEGNAKITEEGIQFKKMLYTCEDVTWLNREMVDARMNGRKSLAIRYDQRNTGVIYFSLNGKYVKGWLNPRKTINEKYQGLSHMEVFALEQREKKMAGIIEESSGVMSSEK